MRYPRTLNEANEMICEELESPRLTQDERHELALIHCHHISDEEAREGRNGHVIAARELQREFFVEILKAVDAAKNGGVPAFNGGRNHLPDVGYRPNWEARR